MLSRREIAAQLRYEGGISRRWFLAYASALSSLPLLGRNSFALAHPKFASDPFALGVASGDPDESGVVLWTRLAPAPLEPFGGMGPGAVQVRWELASDDNFRRIVASGTTVASPQLGHSVHVEVNGLQPDRWYWYRFHAGDATSPVGRTRTAPAADSLPDQLRLAVTSCQHYEQGLYTAYEQMLADHPDLVVHIGDYIYEHAAGTHGKVRKHHGGEIVTLEDYRTRYAQYRLDPLLQQMHAACPWVVTWDDHEVDNNYAGDISEEPDVDPVDFLKRRANAYQAYYEMMPLRQRCLPRGPDMRLFRGIQLGRLAALHVLDTRQYRSDQPNGDHRSPLNEAALDPHQTLMGKKQKGWLFRRLVRSTATWNVLAQQVMMALVDRAGDPQSPEYSMDQWPGYAAEREELIRFLQTRRVSNPIVLTGDIHSNWANELRIDDRKEEQPVVATEFVGTSLSSGGNGVDKPKNLDALLSANPCVKFHNAQRGYLRCLLTPQSWQTDYVVVDQVIKPGGKCYVRQSFVVEAGDPQLKLA